MERDNSSYKLSIPIGGGKVFGGGGRYVYFQHLLQHAQELVLVLG